MGLQALQLEPFKWSASAVSKLLFLLPHACYGGNLGGRKKCVCSFLLLESARTVVTVPPWITGNIKGISRSNPEVCYLLGFFVFNDTNLAPLPGAFWLPTRKRCSSSGSVLGGGLHGQDQQQCAGGHIAQPRVVWHTVCRMGPTWPKPALLHTCWSTHRVFSRMVMLAVVVKSCFTVVTPLQLTFRMPCVNTEQSAVYAAVAVHSCVHTRFLCVHLCCLVRFCCAALLVLYLINGMVRI